MTVRPASTLMLLRQAESGIEVLMTERAPELLGGGWWVFPGGSVEEADRDEANQLLLDGVDDPEEAAWISAALRETVEEVGLFLTSDDEDVTSPDRGDVYGSLRRAGARFDGASVGYVSNWLAPEGLAKRFDTRFYVAEWRGSVEPAVDGVEAVSCEWVVPVEMLERDRGEYPIIFPTVKHLEFLSSFTTPGEVVEHARAIEVVQVAPRPVDRRAESVSGEIDQARR